MTLLYSIRQPMKIQSDVARITFSWVGRETSSLACPAPACRPFAHP